MADNIRPLAFYMLAGLQKRLRDILALKTPPKLTTAAQMRNWMLDPPSTLEYPFCALRVNSFNISEQGPRANRLAQGILTEYTTEGHDATRLNILPTVYGIELLYIAPDFEDVLTFLSTWAMASIKYRANFSLTYRNIDMDVTVVIDSELTSPSEKEDPTQIERADFFEYTGNLTLVGYSNTSDPLDNQQVPLIRDARYRVSETNGNLLYAVE
jgi:hypothetical protein